MLISLLLQAFDPLTRTVGPFLMKMKIVNRLVCQVVTQENQGNTIFEFDQELTVRAATVCNQLATIGKSKAWERILLPTKELLFHIIGAKDGSLADIQPIYTWSLRKKADS